MRKLLHAINLAIEAHQGQKRKYTNDPYIVHPMGVAQLYFAITEQQNEISLGACWLHDVLEDTKLSPFLIKALCGEGVLKLVEELTQVSKPEDGNRATRKAMDRGKLWGVSREAQIIKCCDIIENCSSIALHDKDFAVIYFTECLEILSGFPQDLPGRADAEKTIQAWQPKEP